MLTGQIHRPGQIVQVSGQYGVCDIRGSYLGREATCVRGERFPPTRPATREYGWRLSDRTQHSR
jgi:hypothetical protein